MDTTTLSKKEEKNNFDLDYAYALYFSPYEDLTDRDDKQIEAIHYALQYSIRGDKESQKFIVEIIQHDKEIRSKTVELEAKNAFVKFFGNYVRTECERHFKRNATDTYTESHIQEDTMNAYQTVWISILKYIKTYDTVNGAALTTWSKSHIKDGISTYIAKKKARCSKSTLLVDKKVMNAQKRMIEKGMQPNTILIAKELGLKFEQVEISIERMKGENQTVSVEANAYEELKNSPSETMLDPQVSILMREQSKFLIDTLKKLTPKEYEVVRLIHGIDIDEDTGTIYDDINLKNNDSKNYGMSPKDVATRLNISIFDVKKLLASAYKTMGNIIKKEYGLKQGKKKDMLLHNRSIIFSNQKENPVVADTIDDIITIEMDCNDVIPPIMDTVSSNDNPVHTKV